MTVKNLCVRLVCLVFLISAVATTSAAQPANQTAAEFYMSYRAAMGKAKAIEDLAPFMSKEMKGQVDSTPAAERPKMFEFVKEMTLAMKGVKVVKEAKAGDGVTLTVEGMDGKEKMTGEVQIVREGGAWKMGRERWSNK